MKLGHVVGAIVSVLAVGAAACGAPTPTHTGADMDLRGMPKVGAVDERFQSYNIEMASVTGADFWKPYGAQSSASTPRKNAPAGMDPDMYEYRPRVI